MQTNLATKEDSLEVGFLYYFVLMKLRDLNPGDPLRGMPSIGLEYYVPV